MERSPHPAMTEDERNKLVEEYLPLVGHVLGRLTIHLPATLDRDDLFATGVLGLMDAMRTFDPRRGAIFKTHAYTTIRGSILDEIRRHDPVPRSRRDRVKQVARAERAAADRLGRTPTAEEIASEAGLAVDQVEDALVNAHGAATFSIDAASTGGQGDDEARFVRLLATPEGDDPADRASTAELIKRLGGLVHELPERERRVIVLYYSEGLRLKEIGAVLGVTESRVSQLHARALHALNRRMAESPSVGASASR